MVELILGGARSGKSRFAEQRATKAAEAGKEVVYLATATVGQDSAMAARIALHRDRRPASWALHEQPRDLPEALDTLMAPQRLVLVDCLTLWLTNELLAEADMSDALDRLDQVLRRARGQVVLVSNEVGQGVVPMNALSRRFVDISGEAHQRVAQCATSVWWVVAGLPQCLKGPVNEEPSCS
ncbi:bifunctional adenosylcobinamide kinase/adenosylcobinamide-phosphate guanylyltransferase [Larsenimonas rhizosphaerae]|uniref:Bifunctional adenosylcobalamin biosynthesis protein n=1 Tax=Larsenimonas rhizosphaerae TaxID=2944682 RepID=A0AA41ZDB1_9GAMM|nr:bifunctional adenosylcobinamide kinase/adenosylcobinamide-phosphate guanylyltransferase [Larsenimonas rhizosphaerae]MCX2523194.1 bifunctional adenosylcobinamide kinase/adenosylcobinamide-phosphate guanylyltransferase [Larsenimonas rhizosphaerae]